MNAKRFTIENLCDLTGFTRRTIRYYIQEGLLEPPAGRGRGGFYFDSHLDRLRQIKALQDEGLKLAQVQEILSTAKRLKMAPLREIWVRHSIEPGIEIHIQKELDETEGKKLAEIIRVARSILKRRDEK